MYLHSGHARVAATATRIGPQPGLLSTTPQARTARKRRAVVAQGRFLITFEGGAGVTSAITYRQVTFTCHVPLRTGQKLHGYVLMPRTAERSSTAGCYVARVTRVRPEISGSFEVTARFVRPDA